ncbi:MAG: heparan N-sulfatase, partial [Verrucomicrobiota bacterium]
QAGQLEPRFQQCFIQPRPTEELYDTQNDPHELTNLATKPEYEKTLSALRVALDQWAERTGDRLPSKRTPDEFDRQTGVPNEVRRRPRWSKEKMIEEGMTGR